MLQKMYEFLVYFENKSVLNSNFIAAESHSIKSTIQYLRGLYIVKKLFLQVSGF